MFVSNIHGIVRDLQIPSHATNKNDQQTSQTLDLPIRIRSQHLTTSGRICQTTETVTEKTIMKVVNLQEFWSVQECSGGATHIFSTQEQVEVAIERWDAELDEQFVRWESGDCTVSDSLVHSTLEPDLEGGCYLSWQVNPAWRPGGFYHHEPFTEDAAMWENDPGFDSISWGNPATARPSKQ